MQELDAICDEFEACWRTGERPQLRNFLDRVPADCQPQLLRELLASDLFHRKRAGEHPDIEDYLSQLTQLKQVIQEAFSQTRAEEMVSEEVDFRQATMISREHHPQPATNGDSLVPEMIGNYALLKKLGQGGMGAVYQARHVKLRKIVALKILPQELTCHAEAVARFEREMAAIGTLEHPHIVRAYDAGMDSGIHYLVMEYVEGTDVAQKIRDSGPLSVSEALQVLQQMVQGLTYAHEHGLVHRDIKPSNLFWTTDNQIKILDLGLARLQEDEAASELTCTGQVLGTPAYMAPEQWESTHQVDARADLYSVGCTLHFLLTGRAPFAVKVGNSAAAIFKAHLLQPAPDLTEARADVPPEVNQLFQRLMEKNPDDRIQTAAELGQRLSVLMATAPSANSPDDQASIPGAAQSQPMSTAPGARDATRAGLTVPTSHPDTPPRIAPKRFPFWISAGMILSVVLLVGVMIARMQRNPDVEPSRNPSLIPAIPETPANLVASIAGTAKSNPIPEEAKSTSRETDPQAMAHPPLEEWMQGRKILTVKQDGSAMYSTIQAALDAQQDGEVVQVLDRGPYRETLRWGGRKEAGLISNVGTVIHSQDWKISRAESSERVLHRLGNLRDCRLGGFIFLYQQQITDDHLVLQAYDVSRFCLEDSVFMKFSSTAAISDPRITLFSDEEAGGMTHVHGCLFDTTLYANAMKERTANYQIDHNWWLRSEPATGSKYVLVSSPTSSLIVSENIFDAPGLENPIALNGYRDQMGTSRQRYTRNTVLQPADRMLICFEGIPGQDVAITQNLWPFTIPVLGVPTRMVPNVQSHWKIQENYGGKSGELPQNGWRIPLASSERRGEIRYLSTDPQNRNYARLDPEWVKTRLSETKIIPGALPPGPVPEAGDWLTDLQERYHKIMDSRTTIAGSGKPEPPSADLKKTPLETDPQLMAPPPLEEWMQGRKILTVKQDGSAMYSTIQAALDAQQDGEVVQVLDRGPYRESLRWSNKDDAGLISTAGTIVLSDKNTWTDAPSSTERLLHHLMYLNGCRLSGLTLLYEQQTKNDSTTFRGYKVENFCMEDCVVISLPSHEILCEPRIQFYAKAEKKGSHICLRRCLFAPLVVALTAEEHATEEHAVEYLIYQNWWLNPQGLKEHGYALTLTQYASLVATENIFDVPDLSRAISLQGLLEENEDRRIFWSRNTILRPAATLMSLYGLVRRDVTITQNLWPFSRAVINIPADQRSTVPQHWIIRNNFGGQSQMAHPPESQISLVSPESQGEIRYLSTDPQNRNYARLDPEWVKTRLSETKIIPGALPPGPAPEAGDWLTRLQDRYREMTDSYAATSEPGKLESLPAGAKTASPQRVNTSRSLLP